MDLGHQLTDEELEKLERKIAKVYKTAADEMQDKITEYFKKFDEQDKKKRELLEQGKITEQEYKQWRLGKLATGKKYQSMRDQLAERMTNANQEAVAYVNSSTPTVYSLNRNYTAYQIEQAGINASFQLWDENTVARLIKDNPELMPNYPKEKALARGIDLDWGKKQISKEITTGILLGESNQSIAKRLLTELPDMNKASAIRTARTATTSAECAGRQDTYMAAKNMGIVLKKEWQSAHDARTRDAHIAADGQKVEVEQPFIVGGERLMNPGDPSGSGWNIYNCFSGDIKVASDSKAIRSYKHEYNGDLICIKTSAGVEFTCTPNHPILTPDGWVSANAFNKGDDILITIVGNNMLFGRNPDIEHIFPSFSAFHKSIKMFRGQRAIALGVDFHGDIATTDVEVVTQKGFLPENGDTSRFKSLRKFIFKHTYISLACKSAFMEHFRRICKPSFSLISFKRILFSFFKSHIAHSNIHRFGTTSNMNICLPEYSINNLPTETIIRSELLNGFTAKVFVDKVVDVKIISSNSHVYNLQTENGYYFVNSIIPQNGSKVNGIFAIAKNCRCTTVADVDTKASAKNKNPVSFNKWIEQKQSGKIFANGEEANKWFGQRPNRSLRKENRAEYDRLTEEYKNSQYGKWVENLSMEQITSISYYSGDDYSGINGLLRGHMTEKMVNAWNGASGLTIQQKIAEIESAIEQFELNSPIKVFRTCERDVLDSLKLEVGSIFHDDGFGSTSILQTKVASGNVIMQINVPQGKGLGAWINPLSGAEDEEYEFLLQRGSDYIVKGFRNEGEDTIIELDLIGHTKKDYHYATREEVIERWKRLGLYDAETAKKI